VLPLINLPPIISSSFNDCGIVSTFTGSLDEIKMRVKREVAELESWEFDEENMCLTWSCEGEHDHRIPKEDRIPFIETYHLYLTEVITKQLNPTVLQK